MKREQRAFAFGLALLAWCASGLCRIHAATNLVFSETMATNASTSWTGADCDNVWIVTFSGSNPFAQGTNWNNGSGNPCGMQFKQGNVNLASNMITLAQGIVATGGAAYAEFYLKTSSLTSNTGWTFQLDAGTGFVTRLGEMTGTNHNWQLYHYDLQPGELGSNLFLRFQFAGGATSNRISLDQISLFSMPATNVFGGTLLLGRPTDNSITINILADSDLAAYIDYGNLSGAYACQTALTNLIANAPTEVEITGLQADTRYYYRLSYKQASESSYHVDQEHTFHTQRGPGSTFTFSIQGDSHPERVGIMFDSGLYTRTLQTAASDQPDFYMTIGDDFSVDQIPTNSINADLVTARYTLQRPYLGLIGNSVPLFLVNGNHEQAAAYLLDGTSNNIAVWAQTARNKYYSEPAPNGFYSGNTNVVPFIGLLRNFFAWTWGDALFVTIDPYWASSICVDNPYWGGSKRTNMWDVTHGDVQYQWLKATLEQSTAKYKFVFAHHVLGTGRGGIEEAGSYEWGGQNADGSWGFTTNRPTWALPLHQLMVSNNVTIFFQGHDHIFVRQQLDGVTYQTLPNPADPNYSLFNSDAYTNTLYKTNNTGYVRVTVAPEDVKVDYVRTFLPFDEGVGKTNGMVGYSYTLVSSVTNQVAYDVMLGRPTDTSIAVSLLASNDLRAYVEYGTQPGVFTGQTATNSVTNGVPSVINLMPLQADQPYYYRIRFLQTGGAPFKAGDARMFHTRRARGSTFTFDIEADPHYNDTAGGWMPAVWQQTLTNILADQPDFLIDLGDTFMGEKRYSSYGDTNAMTQSGILAACAACRAQFFDIAGHSVPLFLVDGNHDPELGWWLDTNAPHANPPVCGASARGQYYPCPISGGFYSGATNSDAYQQGPRDGYYAFEWGNALFVVLDPFWYSNQGVNKSSNPWAWTLGTNQYYWLKTTLETSSAPFKFVFCHHLVGGSFDAAARGGLEYATYFEWGGYNTNGTWGFTDNRPGWPMPIQSLLLSNNVNAFFHGHDHLYVKQDYRASGATSGPPDLIYQEVPQPSHYPYDSIGYATGTNIGYNYQSGVFFGSSGHLRVTVTPTNTIVDYVRSYRPSDVGPGKTNRMVSYSYTISNHTASVSADSVGDGIPDWWRALYFGGDGTSTNARSCATCDADGTGQNNLAKYLADLDPTNPASRLAIISIASSNQDIHLTWIGGSNSWQYLETSRSLVSSNWVAVYTNIRPAPVTNIMVNSVTVAVTNLFFRISAHR
ncbi:MAG: metallophosphoesterase [bacterium]